MYNLAGSKLRELAILFKSEHEEDFDYSKLATFFKHQKQISELEQRFGTDDHWIFDATSFFADGVSIDISNGIEPPIELKNKEPQKKEGFKKKKSKQDKKKWSWRNELIY